jgi:epoxyqueuosine reductase
MGKALYAALMPRSQEIAPLREQISAFAKHLGFDAVGFARADVPLTSDYARYQAFLEAGFQGTMDYLAENREARAHLDHAGMLVGAKTVVCLARRYDRSDDDQDPPVAQLIARYARGRDYHTVVRRKLRQLAALVRRVGPAGTRARPLCDDAPILERAWAARAGLGFVGKNGLLIVPGAGSFVLLGEVVTTLELPEDAPIAERCGTCTRCLDVCPTQAFAAPFVLDPRKCISYWTIEHRGELPDPKAIGAHLFGCDDCQTVCPFNASKHRAPAKTAAFAPHPRWADTTLTELADPALAEPLIAESPLRRATAAGIARNARAVLRNVEGARSVILPLESGKRNV